MAETPDQSLPLLKQLLQIQGMSLRPSYSNAEASVVLDCSRRTILNYIHKGLLSPRMLPGRKTFLPCDIEEMLQRRRTT